MDEKDENSLYAKNEMNLVIQEVKAVLDSAAFMKRKPSMLISLSGN